MLPRITQQNKRYGRKSGCLMNYDMTWHSIAWHGSTNCHRLSCLLSFPSFYHFHDIRAQGYDKDEDIVPGERTDFLVFNSLCSNNDFVRGGHPLAREFAVKIKTWSMVSVRVKCQYAMSGSHHHLVLEGTSLKKNEQQRR